MPTANSAKHRVAAFDGEKFEGCVSVQVSDREDARTVAARYNAKYSKHGNRWHFRAIEVDPFGSMIWHDQKPVEP
jgi:hypothetical protein